MVFWCFVRSSGGGGGRGAPWRARGGVPGVLSFLAGAPLGAAAAGSTARRRRLARAGGERWQKINAGVQEQGLGG